MISYEFESLWEKNKPQKNKNKNKNLIWVIDLYRTALESFCNYMYIHLNILNNSSQFR